MDQVLRIMEEVTSFFEDQRIESSALNEWLFNEDTIRLALNLLMTNGLKIDYGEKLGKTIIFAKNHRHAEKIREVFYKEYPHLPGYAQVIDNQMTYPRVPLTSSPTRRSCPRLPFPWTCWTPASTCRGC